MKIRRRNKKLLDFLHKSRGVLKMGLINVGVHFAQLVNS